MSRHGELRLRHPGRALLVILAFYAAVAGLWWLATIIAGWLW